MCHMPMYMQSMCLMPMYMQSMCLMPMYIQSMCLMPMYMQSMCLMPMYMQSMCHMPMYMQFMCLCNAFVMSTKASYYWLTLDHSQPALQYTVCHCIRASLSQINLPRISCPGQDIHCVLHWSMTTAAGCGHAAIFFPSHTSKDQAITSIRCCISFLLIMSIEHYLITACFHTGCMLKVGIGRNQFCFASILTFTQILPLPGLVVTPSFSLVVVGVLHTYVRTYVPYAALTECIARMYIS